MKLSVVSAVFLKSTPEINKFSVYYYSLVNRHSSISIRLFSLKII
jgi:hypothetical protein